MREQQREEGPEAVRWRGGKPGLSIIVIVDELIII